MSTLRTWGEVNREAGAKLEAFFAEAPEGEAYTAAQAGNLAGAKFAAYTTDALLREVDRLEAEGLIEKAGYRAGSPTYRKVPATSVLGGEGPVLLGGSFVARKDGRGPLRSKLVRQATTVELHLSSDPELPKRYGRRIRTAGGSYSSCRGSAHRRYVKVPVLTPEGVALADELARAYGTGPRTTVVLRGGSRRAEYVGRGISKEDRESGVVGAAARLAEEWFRAAVAGGTLLLVSEEELAADDARALAEERERKFERLERLRAEVASLEAELGESS